MLPSTPQATRQLVADHIAGLAASRPRRSLARARRAAASRKGDSSPHHQ